MSAAARAAGLTVLAASAVAWLLLEEMAWPVRAMTVFLLVPLPALLSLQARIADEIPGAVDREAVYLSSALSVWVLAALCMLAARFGGLTRVQLRLQALDSGTLLLAAALATAGGLLLMAAGRLLRLPESRLVEYLLPRTGSERIAFAGLSVSAGIAEELVFRSFLIGGLAAAGVPLAFAVALSIAAFAAAHAYQGLAGVLRVTLLGAVLTAPFLLTGSVFPSMIAHTVLDLLAGLVLADWLLGSPRH